MHTGTVAKTILLSAIATSVATPAMAITAQEYATIVNFAGRQRMLSQMMSKEMLLIAYGYNSAENRKQLERSTTMFDETLACLLNGCEKPKIVATKDSATIEKLNEVKALWKEFKAIADKVAKGEQVQVDQVVAKNVPLLQTMNKAVELYEAAANRETGQQAGTVINLAGRQRMLTQKITKELVQYALQGSEEARVSLRASVELFDKTLNGLVKGDAELGLPATTDKMILNQMKAVEANWKNFRPVVEKAVSAGKPSHEDIAKVAELNLGLLGDMNQAVDMFQKATH